MSLAIGGSNNLFIRFFNIFKQPKDPFTKSVNEALLMLDKMINHIEATKKSLESKHEEHERRAKIFASEGKRDYEEIFLEESKHISGLINMFSKVQHDLLRVKYRLETITIVEEPMKVLPRVLEELEAIRPDLERVAPNLMTLLLELERKVTNIMSTSKVESRFANSINEVKDKVILSIPPLPPEDVKIDNKVVSVVKEPGINLKTTNIEQVKKILLNEIRRTGGVIVVNDVVRKYGLSREAVLMALNKLEEEGIIKSKN
ncbi:MAG: winged helix-turn-helix transcriptional regulator [Desulfurococcaceae archaeon]